MKNDGSTPAKKSNIIPLIIVLEVYSLVRINFEYNVIPVFWTDWALHGLFLASFISALKTKI